MTDALPRIFFDSNEGTHEHGYWLNLSKSRRDLERLGDQLREGLHVLLHMPDEFEVEAVLRFDIQSDHWVGMPVAGTLRYLDGSDQA
jgi:hypothetical protein